jgi:prephenate dehydrogenase
MRVAVVGLGLIGGSVALACREHAGAEVCGWDADPGVVAAALRLGAIDHGAASLTAALAEAEVAFVAVPVGALPRTVGEVLASAPPGCAVTDVGSTKRAIVAAVDDQRFVGGHPLAGAETAGILHARSDLFEGATWYLTPTAQTSGILFERLHKLVGALGARPTAIEADVHDRMLALVSHLPHVLANVLVGEATTALGAEGERLPATGPSFRDMTRVAGAPSAIWTDIYLSNRDALIEQIDAIARRLAAVRDALARGDADEITAWNESAAAARRRLLESELAGGDLHELRVSVPNRPGVIATLALELGRAGVNIPDLALYPAPDMSEGVVAIWIRAEQAARAQEIIAGLGFPVAPA